VCSTISCRRASIAAARGHRHEGDPRRSGDGHWGNAIRRVPVAELAVAIVPPAVHSAGARAPTCLVASSGDLDESDSAGHETRDGVTVGETGGATERAAAVRAPATRPARSE